MWQFKNKIEIPNGTDIEFYQDDEDHQWIQIVIKHPFLDEYPHNFFRSQAFSGDGEDFEITIKRHILWVYQMLENWITIIDYCPMPEWLHNTEEYLNGSNFS